MKPLQTLILLFAFLLFQLFAQAQVPQNVIVEHFTNTRCSICASSSKNPAFYTNLANYPDVLHVSYHPSAPYTNCLFSLHNPSENDGRTKYYGTYGSTPDLVVQGKLSPVSIPFSSPNIFAPYLDKATAFSIEILQTKTVDEKIEATVTIKAEAQHNYSGAALLVGLAEKFVSYAAPNGEDEHHDVFRKSFTDIEGDQINMPVEGESVSFSYSIENKQEWEFSEMYVYAILNDSETKEVIQAQAADPSDNVTSISAYNTSINASIYPNPAQDILHIELESGIRAELQIINASGELVQGNSFESSLDLDVSNLVPGMYFLTLQSESGTLFSKIIIE